MQHKTSPTSSFGITLYGLFLFALALICVLFVALGFLGSYLAAGQGGPVLPLKLQLAGLWLYLVVAVLFVTLGVGILRRKKWARTVTHAFSLLWLIMGVVACAVVPFLLPGLDQTFKSQGQPVPPAVVTITKIFIFVLLSVMYVLIPGALYLYIRRRKVEETFRYFDSDLSWTDRLPFPLVVLEVIIAFGLCSFVSLFFYNSIVPFFGTMLSGAPGSIALLVLLALWSYLLVGVCQQKRTAWITLLSVLALLTISGLLTISRISSSELYQMMGMPDAVINQMKAYSSFEPSQFFYISLGPIVALLGYIYSLKRYFTR